MKTEMEPLIVPLWPDGVMNSTTDENPEVRFSKEDGNYHLSQVTQPELQAFLPRVDRPTAAVVICPGGGYAFLSFRKEGLDFARFLASQGIAGIVLKYRLPDARYQETPSIAPLQDAQRALQLLRERAGEYDIDPQRLGIMGFSAGGHLASTVATQWKDLVIPGTDPDQVRPDFSILAYPVITLSEGHALHLASRRNLLGENPRDEQCRKFSAEKQVDQDTPPAFLVHAMDDSTVPVENSINYLMALRRAGVNAEGHFYQAGEHGFGMRPGPADSWPITLIRWIRLNFGE